ncbi:MAG: ABC transporter ATP-binding protein [Candidatus Helarchaeota archaeon]
MHKGLNNMKLEIKNLIKKYSNGFILNIPELTIKEGEILGLVGNNGAGKTTFLRLILDLLQANEGVVMFNGKNVTQDESWKLYTGSYLDDSFIIDFLTPEEFFQFVGATYKMSKRQVNDSLKEFEVFFKGEVLGKKKKYIRDYSKGNIQKIGIAAAMLSEPRLLVLDEPFNNLDPTSQILLKNLIKKFNRDKRCTVVISSHNLKNIIEISTRIVLLENGQIIRDIRNIKDVSEVEQELDLYFEIAHQQ